MVYAIQRQRFLDEYWDYRPGEHVTFLAPNGGGKTTLAMQCLDASPKLLTLVCDTKPKSKEMDEAIKRYGFTTRTRWPLNFWDWWLNKKRPRWVIRPPHRGSFEENEVALKQDLERILHWAYTHDIPTIVFADEMLDWVDVGLKTPMRVIWTRGRSAGVGLWGGSQRPFDVPLYAYGQARHLFLGRDTDHRSVQRYSEIAGFDPQEIKRVVQQLPLYHFLYLNRRDFEMMVVTA